MFDWKKIEQARRIVSSMLTALRGHGSENESTCSALQSAREFLVMLHLTLGNNPSCRLQAAVQVSELPASVLIVDTEHLN